MKQKSEDKKRNKVKWQEKAREDNELKDGPGEESGELEKCI